MGVFVPQVVSIHISALAAAAMTTRKRVTLVAGKGILGDRYYRARGTFSKKNGPDREVTLIEEEALLAALRDYSVKIRGAMSRRNLVTRGVALNHLVGQMFSVGDDVVLEGLRLCEPCGHLAKLTGSTRVREALIHRGGLRARIVEGGIVRGGDVVSTYTRT